MKRFFSNGAATFFLAVSFTHGADQPLQSPVLNMAGARSAAMSLAFASVGGDIDAISINPAGVAAVKQPWLSTSYRRGLSDDNWGYIHYAHPVPFGSLFAGGSYVDAGSIDVRFTNGTQETRRAEQDFAGLLGAGFDGDWLAGGVTAKMIRMELAETASVTGYAADAGVLAKTPLTGFSLGASVQNVGPAIKFEQESEPLPERLRYGASYLLDFSRWGGSYKVLVSVDGVSETENGTAVHSGIDISHDLTSYDKEGWIALRGGYQSDIESFSAGLGIGIHNFLLDYAVRLHSDLNESHFVTLGYQFSPAKDDAPKQKSPRLIR